MPRCNRVDPQGNLIATPARGTLMGNRGCLHDAASHPTGRRWATKTWIACRLAFKDRRRRLVTPGRYTELFFLDEATAFAAGHRPCAECRREDYRRFKRAWLAGRPATDDLPAAALDAVLHRERIGPPPVRVRIAYIANIGQLPDGAMIEQESAAGAWLVLGDRLLRWSPYGYDAAMLRTGETPVRVLTPRSVVAAFAAGYAPAIHPSAPGLARPPRP
ncbi:MAG: hypothetical protein HY057_13085 [Rhodospirillales bacterium]|nr:hypothetical protein [Rhodospirillales bacterium]